MTNETEHKIKLAAAGDNCMDVYDDTGMAYPGGNPLNVAIYTCRLGGNASYTGVVGDDEYGEQLRRYVADKGVDVSHLHTMTGNTAVTHVKNVNGERILGDYEEGVMTQFRLSDEDIKFLAEHDLVVSGIWGRLEGDLPRLKALEVPVAFDFADKPQGPLIEDALPYVDYAFFSGHEGTEAELKLFLERMQERGPKVTVITLGHRGSMAFDGSQYYTQGIIECEVVDTMGAGDSYIAGFLYGIMRGDDIPACMLAGAKCSAVTLQYYGA